jgi:hypothetical protein
MRSTTEPPAASTYGVDGRSARLVSPSRQLVGALTWLHRHIGTRVDSDPLALLAPIELLVDDPDSDLALD